jgi:catechol 2,3-dioxygenase-like lactoylglutathione lyase family enzyme
VAFRFDHIHITAEDPRRSARWWAETFGADILPEVESTSILFVPVMLDGTKITLSTPRPSGTPGPPAPVPHYGLEHIGIRVEDVARTVQVLEEQGFEVYETKQTPQYRIAFVAGPDGICLELMEPLG